MSKMLYTCFTKIIIDYLLSLNKSIPCRSDSKLHNSQDDRPITKTNSEYKFGMNVLDDVISDAIKKKAWYKYCIAKKVESEKAKIVDKLEEQHVSLIKSGRGKGFILHGDQVANVPNKLMKDVVLRKTRSLTIAEKTVVGELAKFISIQESCSQRHTASDATLYSSSSDESEESANEIDDTDEYDMDLSHDNPHGDDDDARYGVFMYKKFTATPNSTYLSLTITSSSLDFIKTLLDETLVNELTEIKKLLLTRILNAIENYVKPRLNTSVIEVMKTNQINLFTQLSTSTDDLLEIDLKLKLLNRIHSNKSNEIHTTHQQLYDTLYESIILDQDALNAQATQLSFHRRSHDNQDPPNNREGKNKKKHQKDDENHILGPSNVAIAKKFKELIQKDELSIADLEGAGLERLKKLGGIVMKEMSLNQDHLNDTCQKVQNHILASTIMTTRIEDKIPERWNKEVHHYYFEALIVSRYDDKEYEFSYADLPRLNMNDVEDMYLLQVQDKLHHLPLEFVKDFNNALLMFIRRTMIKNMVEDIHLRVESYQRTLNLTKPTMFFE
uniref:Uncharacterized protein n=1 Tax=Tanacetum cinerariifolium TaxID=118510 RepID=A0A6L2N3Z3_TANCI|nr:hypothetical protein [Tanacetum cinerariifolium]